MILFVYVIYFAYTVERATQNMTSSHPVCSEQKNKNKNRTNCDRLIPVMSSSTPVMSNRVCSSKPKMLCSNLSLKQTCSSDSHPRRQCSAEEIERKKQEALRRRRVLALKMWLWLHCDVMSNQESLLVNLFVVVICMSALVLVYFLW